jgi:hypothetical protein
MALIVLCDISVSEQREREVQIHVSVVIETRFF